MRGELDAPMVPDARRRNGVVETGAQGDALQERYDQESEAPVVPVVAKRRA